DLGVTVLLALSVGLGLYRQEARVNPASPFYFVEGCVSGCLIALQWWITNRGGTSFGQLSRRALGIIETKSEPKSLRASSISVFAAAKWLLIEATRRDVDHFFFVLVAVRGESAWILHFMFEYPLIDSDLTMTALTRSSPS